MTISHLPRIALIATCLACIGAGQAQARPPKPKLPSHAPSATHPTAHSAIATTSSISNYSFGAECNWYYHTNKFASQGLLNENRPDLKNGAYIAFRYAYNRAGTSTWNYTGWYGPTWATNVKSTGSLIDGSTFSTVGPFTTQAIHFNVTSGQIYGWAQAAVLNQATRQYEYTQTYADYYGNYGQYNIAGGSSSACWVSL